MTLPEFSTRYPVTISMATFAVILLGWISLGGLGTDLLPSVQTPVITVDLQVPGKSPQEMEERYTRRLERDISTVSGVERVYSITRSGQAVVAHPGEWVRYSTPEAEGAEYVAICLPAFAPGTVHRDDT